MLNLFRLNEPNSLPISEPNFSELTRPGGTTAKMYHLPNLFHLDEPNAEPNA
jgi:hypothetical protein